MHGRAIQWFPVICQGMGGGGSNVTEEGVGISLVKFDGNDNAPGAPHIISHAVTTSEAILRLSVRHIIRSSAVLLACLLPHRSVAQSTTTLLPDATTLPARAI